MHCWNSGEPPNSLMIGLRLYQSLACPADYSHEQLDRRYHWKCDFIQWIFCEGWFNSFSLPFNHHPVIFSWIASIHKCQVICFPVNFFLLVVFVFLNHVIQWFCLSEWTLEIRCFADVTLRKQKKGRKSTFFFNFLITKPFSSYFVGWANSHRKEQLSKIDWKQNQK